VEYIIFKRLFDIVCVLLFAPILVPIFLISTIAIRIETKGSPIFTQTRTGKDKREFTIYKLRSMYEDTSSHDLTIDDDKRITKIGKFIRKTRIDEIPQLWNVLKNDMSIVGPRPEYIGSDRIFRKSIPYYDYRYLVKPGVTGWSQVNVGHTNDEESTRDKLEADIYYVKNISLWLDIHIILKTLKVVCSGQGAR
jgi:lipopolysaccharide/colanic/teichoic acid biosynthesis glycosyltransferase